MIEIRLHGRGGQGVVTCAEIIAIAAFHDGKYSQAFPYFGVERSGAPIESYARIDENFINLREQVKEPDIVIIQDASLLETVDVLSGVKNGGIILINTSKDLKEAFKNTGKISQNKFLLANNYEFKIIKIDGTSIALKILGKPIVNTLMALALAKESEIISANSVKKALKEKFKGDLLKKNLELAKEI